jgi:hypothetical protein
MRLDSRAFGLAAGAIAAALFTLCALAVAIAPTWTTAVASTLIHLDLTGIARTITWGSYFAGLVCWSIGTGLVFAAVGGLYNRFLSRVPAVAQANVAAHRSV